jgi:hypothetical protein
MSIIIVPNAQAKIMDAEQQVVLFGNVSLMESYNLTLHPLDEAIIDLHSSYQNIQIICSNESQKNTASLDVQPLDHEFTIAPGTSQTQEYPVIFPSVLMIKNITNSAEDKVSCKIKAIQN